MLMSMFAPQLSVASETFIHLSLQNVLWLETIRYEAYGNLIQSYTTQHKANFNDDFDSTWKPQIVQLTYFVVCAFENRNKFILKTINCSFYYWL